MYNSLSVIPFQIPDDAASCAERTQVLSIIFICLTQSIKNRAIQTFLYASTNSENCKLCYSVYRCVLLKRYVHAVVTGLWLGNEQLNYKHMAFCFSSSPPPFVYFFDGLHKSTLLPPTGKNVKMSPLQSLPCLSSRECIQIYSVDEHVYAGRMAACQHTWHIQCTQHNACLKGASRHSMVVYIVCFSFPWSFLCEFKSKLLFFCNACTHKHLHIFTHTHTCVFCVL